MSEFVDVTWFGREHTIGIVLTYDEFDGFKARMAPVPLIEYHSGLGVNIPLNTNVEGDVKWLMANAAKIPFEWAWGIFGRRMVAYWQDKHLDLDSWPTVRYDHYDYDVKTLEEVQHEQGD